MRHIRSTANILPHSPNRPLAVSRQGRMTLWRSWLPRGGSGVLKSPLRVCCPHARILLSGSRVAARRILPQSSEPPDGRFSTGPDDPLSQLASKGRFWSTTCPATHLHRQWEIAKWLEVRNNRTPLSDLILLVKDMLCSKFDCQKEVKLILFEYEIRAMNPTCPQPQRAPPHSSTASGRSLSGSRSSSANTYES